MDEKPENAMDEKPDISLENSSEIEKISVGAKIRKQRISMNISIEKISKDLKINKVYIQAIEDDDHDAIPAAPYVRVYLKTIAEYLSLDSAELLRQLLEEKSGNKSGSAAKEKGKDNEKKDKTKDKDKNSYAADSEKEETLSVSLSEDKKNSNFGLLVLLLVLLIVLAYFVMSQKNEQNSDAKYDNEQKSEKIAEESSNDTLPDSPSDSLGIQDDATAQNSPIEVQIQITKDSSWIQIFADGKFVRKGYFNKSSEKIVLTANDSVIVHTGNSFGFEIFLDGKQVDRSGSTTRHWRLKKDDVKNISNSEWERILKQ